MNLPDFSNQTPRAIALDLDETTLNSSARLDDRTRDVLHAIHKLTVPIIIATSRPQRVLSTLVGDDILEISSLVQMNGSVATGRAGLNGHFKKISTSPMVISFKTAMKIRPAKISINGVKRDLEALATILEQELSDKTVVFRAASKLFLNVVPTTASKSLAIDDLLKSTDISLMDVLSFGDDFVDIDLMRDCGWSVAMDNAIPEIKNIAKYHTASNDNNGVAIVLERLILALS